METNTPSDSQTKNDPAIETRKAQGRSASRARAGRGVKPAPVFSARTMGDVEHMDREVERIRQFAEAQGVPTPNWDCNWHSCYEHTVVDDWADLEEDFLEAGYVVIRTDRDWHLFSPRSPAADKGDSI